MTLLKKINLLVGVVVVVALLFAGFFLDKLLQQDLSPQQNAMVVLKSDPACDLNEQACSASIDALSVKLHFKQVVKYLTRFDVEVVTNGFKAFSIEKMSIDFNMVDMKMGINRFALKQTDKKNVWQGMAILPVCITGRKDWRVKLYLADSQSNYVAKYKLTVEN